MPPAATTGTFTARTRPWVVLTSNDTRELSAALKRRCLHYHLGYPAADRERAERVTEFVLTGEVTEGPGAVLSARKNGRVLAGEVAVGVEVRDERPDGLDEPEGRLARRQRRQGVCGLALRVHGRDPVVEQVAVFGEAPCPAPLVARCDHQRVKRARLAVERAV